MKIGSHEYMAHRAGNELDRVCGCCGQSTVTEPCTNCECESCKACTADIEIFFPAFGQYKQYSMMGTMCVACAEELANRWGFKKV